MDLGNLPVGWGISPSFEGIESSRPGANRWMEEWEVYSHSPISHPLIQGRKAWPTHPMVGGCERLLPGQGFASSWCRISRRSSLVECSLGSTNLVGAGDGRVAWYHQWWWIGEVTPLWFRPRRLPQGTPVPPTEGFLGQVPHSMEL